LTGCNNAAEFDKAMLLLFGPEIDEAAYSGCDAAALACPMRPVAAFAIDGCADAATMPPPEGTSNVAPPPPTLLKCTKDDRPPFWAYAPGFTAAGLRRPSSVIAPGEKVAGLNGRNGTEDGAAAAAAAGGVAEEANEAAAAAVAATAGVVERDGAADDAAEEDEKCCGSRCA
jgi:hypothetical protein